MTQQDPQKVVQGKKVWNYTKEFLECVFLWFYYNQREQLA